MKKFVSIVLASLCSMTAASASMDQSSEGARQIHAADVIGIWTCSGKDANDGPVNATLRFYHGRDGSMHFFLRAQDVTFVHPAIRETWIWHDDPATHYRGWETKPENDAWDKVTFTSPGFQGGQLVWTRVTKDIPVVRTIRKLGKDRLSFTQMNGKPPGAQHSYALSCRRSAAGEPGPGPSLES